MEFEAQRRARAANTESTTAAESLFRLAETFRLAEPSRRRAQRRLANPEPRCACERKHMHNERQNTEPGARGADRASLSFVRETSMHRLGQVVSRAWEIGGESAAAPDLPPSRSCAHSPSAAYRKTAGDACASAGASPTARDERR
eukprot:672600-Pleurochrysis_carterae.AAC.2